MKRMLSLIFLLVFIPIASALEVSVEPSSIALSLNGTAVKQINITTVSNYSGVLYLHVFLPFIETAVQPKMITFPNGSNTYYPLITFVTEKSFPAGSYSGFLDYVTDSISGSINLTVTVPENKNYSLSYPQEVQVNTGETGVLVFNITNRGNSDLHINCTSNSSLLMPVSDAIVVYRQNAERLKWYFFIPEDLQPGEHLKTFFLNNDSYQIKFIVFDSVSPILEVSPVENLKVNQNFSIVATAYDNIKLADVHLDLICDGVPAEKYDMSEFATDRFIADIKSLTKPTSCIANIYAVDASGNQNLTSIYFSVDFTQGVTFLKSIEVPKFKTNFLKKVRFIESNESINLSVKLLELVHPNLTNSTDYFAVGIDNGHSLEKFGEVGEEQGIEGKVISINFESTVTGQFSGKLLVTFPEYVMKDNIQEIAFSGEVGPYIVAEAYKGELYGVSLDCTPHDLGTYEQSYMQCKLKMPIDVNPVDAALPISLKQIGLTDENFEHSLKEATEPLKRQIAALTSWLTLSFIFFVVILFFIWVYLKPVIFHLGGL